MELKSIRRVQYKRKHRRDIMYQIKLCVIMVVTTCWKYWQIITNNMGRAASFLVFVQMYCQSPFASLSSGPPEYLLQLLWVHFVLHSSPASLYYSGKY